MIQRILFYIILICIAAFAPAVVLAVAAFAYALRYTAYELIFLAIVIDGLYGSAYLFPLPFYTIVTALCLICIEWIKPRISVYN